MGTTGLMNQIFRDCKAGDAAAGWIEFTPSEHVSAPVAMLRMTEVLLPFDFDFDFDFDRGGKKKRSWRAVLVGW